MLLLLWRLKLAGADSRPEQTLLLHRHQLPKNELEEKMLLNLHKKKKWADEAHPQAL